MSTPAQKALREALEWYRDEAEALARNVATGVHTQAVLASVTVLAIDRGKRAETALAALTRDEPDALDARRYRWLRDRFSGADFDWNRSGVCMLLAQAPNDIQVWGSLDLTVDAALARDKLGMKKEG